VCEQNCTLHTLALLNSFPSRLTVLGLHQSVCQNKVWVEACLGRVEADYTCDNCRLFCAALASLTDHRLGARLLLPMPGAESEGQGRGLEPGLQVQLPVEGPPSLLGWLAGLLSKRVTVAGRPGSPLALALPLLLRAATRLGRWIQR
jgi:hypothetical protein